LQATLCPLTDDDDEAAVDNDDNDADAFTHNDDSIDHHGDNDASPYALPC